jgi:hypothetical protein
MMRWYKGDLHAHSTFSDGRDSLDVLLRRVRENGLEFFALTEHRTVEHLRHMPPDPGLILIPGFEFGDRLGHANLFGISELLSRNGSQDPEQTRASLREARRAGAYIAINHPFHYESTWLLPLDDVDYDWIEIWNGPWFNSNQGCVVWWQAELEKGGRIPVAGGSDCHGNVPFHHYGQPTTWVAAEEPTVRSILENLKRGHSVMSCSPDGPFIDLSCGGSIVGDVVRDAHAPCALAVSGLVKGDIVRMVSDMGVEAEHEMERGGAYEETRVMPDRAFLRVEVLRWYPELLTRQMAALSNPLYLRQPRP